MNFKTSVIYSALLAFGAISASAANLSIDFTTGTLYNPDGNFDAGIHTNDTTTFDGSFLAGFPGAGSTTLDVVDPGTGFVIDSLALSWSFSGSIETFHSVATTGLFGSSLAPAGGDLTVNATGSAVDVTGTIFAATAGVPSNITVEVTENPQAPEPASMALFGSGLLGLAAFARKRRV